MKPTGSPCRSEPGPLCLWFRLRPNHPSFRIKSRNVAVCFSVRIVSVTETTRSETTRERSSQPDSSDSGRCRCSLIGSRRRFNCRRGLFPEPIFAKVLFFRALLNAQAAAANERRSPVASPPEVKSFVLTRKNAARQTSFPCR